MSKWLAVAVPALAVFGCGNKVELSECTSIPPTTFSEEQCLTYGGDAGCAVSRRNTVSLPDGGLSTTCHHENCSSKPYCPSAP